MASIIPRGVGFAQIPRAIIIDKRITHPTLRVYCNLMDRASSAEGRAWPGIRRIAKDIHMSTSTVSKAVEVLEATGWITVERGFVNDTGERAVNQYVVNGVATGVATGDTPCSPDDTQGVAGGATEQQPVGTTTKNKSGDKSPRVLLKDAIAEWWIGTPPPLSLTESEWGRVERAAKELDAIGATAADVKDRGARYWVKMEKSPQGLVQNWTRLAPDTAHVHDFKANGAWGVMCVACGERKPE